MKISGYLFFLVIALATLACSRSGGVVYDPGNDNPHVYNPDDTTFPAIDIFSPADSQVFNSGQLIKIEGRVTDNGLYRGSVKVTNDANGALEKIQLYETHGLQLVPFTVNYYPGVSVTSFFTVTVSYEDHGLNTTIKSVKVKVDP
jgi:hypothetical protein